MSGAFIVFEGIDGSGKSTQAKLLQTYFKEQGLPVALSREPSDGPLGLMLRQVLSGRVKMDEKTMAALFAADRLDHLHNPTNGIAQALANGTNIICDRYYLSTYAYQSIGVDLDWALALNSQAIKPTVHLFIDISVDTALERIRQNRDHTDIFESRARLEHTRECYLANIARLQAQENIVTIDGEQSVAAIAACVQAAVAPLLPKE